MKFWDYFKERIIFILISAGIILFTSILLELLKVDLYVIIFVSVFNFIGMIIFHIYDYFHKKVYYDNVLSNLERLDKKYLISEVIKGADFIEGKIMNEVLQEANKSMNDQVAKFNISSKEYREYIELWVHEIKSPIAASRLMVENNKSLITNSIEEELTRVEDYIEQALFYSRSNSLEKDYIIRKLNLKQWINTVIKRNANILISKGIKVQIENVDMTVYSDSKWIEFILHQIISNSIKYMDKKESILKISCIENNGEVILTIDDNGVGISEKSQEKIFEKGYTGENGRRFGKSTGMGLYLCRNLCEKLGLGIKLQSKDGQGTRVSILFPNNGIDSLVN